MRRSVGDDLVGPEEQQREQRTLLLPAQRDGSAVVEPTSSEPEDAEFEHRPFVALVAAEFVGGTPRCGPCERRVSEAVSEALARA